MLTPYLPLIAAWSTLVAAGMVLLAKGVGILAPPPVPFRSGRARLLLVLLLPFWCLAGQSLIAVIQKELGFPSEEQGIILEAIRTGGFPFLLVAVVLAPLGEELVFRRFLFSTVHRTWGGRVSAYAVTALLFAAIHFNLAGILLYVWMACCFAFAYERTGSVWGAAAVHGINNAIVIVPAMMGAGEPGSA